MTKTLKYEINEGRRPGLWEIVERIRADNPRLSQDESIARAKAEWHRRRPHLPCRRTTSQGEALPDQP